jgi:hypothetical protein
MDAKLKRLKELIELKERTDAELEALLGGAVRVIKQRACKVCGQPGHRSDNCPTKEQKNEAVQLRTV